MFETWCGIKKEWGYQTSVGSFFIFVWSYWHEAVLNLTRIKHLNLQLKLLAVYCSHIVGNVQ